MYQKKKKEEKWVRLKVKGSRPCLWAEFKCKTSFRKDGDNLTHFELDDVGNESCNEMVDEKQKQ